MKHLIILLAVPILACGGSAQPVLTSTITPLALTEGAPASPTAGQPAVDRSTQQPALPNVTRFPDPSQFEWRAIAYGLNRPVDVQSANDGSGRLFILEKNGLIRIFENGQLLAEPFLDITDRVNDSSNEMGLLGLAFHPNYEQNGFFYVNYTGAGGNTFISRFQASQNRADPNSEKNLLKVDQPFPNHNGGVLVFGPGGDLYAGLGDGGSAGDPNKNGQNTAVLLGKILRIDVDHGDPYSIPSDNPFGNEVWAYGLRNPWRISFDRASGDLWIGDVGQNAWEEIDYLPKGSVSGANFGWSLMEGNHPYDGQAQPGLLLPAVDYSHDFGCSVTGGYVYRGSIPDWQGIYLYGDYCSGTIWGLIPNNGQWQNQVIFETHVNINSFGQDESGELYLASDNGYIYQLVKK